VRHVLEILGKEFCGSERLEASRTQRTASSGRKDKGENPDWVWRLKSVERPTEGNKNCFDVRVFDTNAAAEKRISVRDYTSLDKASNLILYEGWYDEISSETVTPQ
jgi:hypothetical protein